MIKKCNCKNKGQDAIHGEGNRVFNKLNSTTGLPKYACTVCGIEKGTDIKRTVNKAPKAKTKAKDRDTSAKGQKKAA